MVHDLERLRCGAVSGVPAVVLHVAGSPAVAPEATVASERALEAFQATDNPVDEEFVTDLQRIIERTRREIEALTGEPVPPPEPSGDIANPS